MECHYEAKRSPRIFEPPLFRRFIFAIFDYADSADSTHHIVLVLSTARQAFDGAYRIKKQQTTQLLVHNEIYRTSHTCHTYEDDERPNENCVVFSTASMIILIKLISYSENIYIYIADVIFESFHIPRSYCSFRTPSPFVSRTDTTREKTSRGIARPSFAGITYPAQQLYTCLFPCAQFAWY